MSLEQSAARRTPGGASSNQSQWSHFRASLPYVLSPLAAPHHRRDGLVFSRPSTQGQAEVARSDGGRGHHRLSYEQEQRSCGELGDNPALVASGAGAVRRVDRRPDDPAEITGRHLSGCVTFSPASGDCGRRDATGPPYAADAGRAMRQPLGFEIFVDGGSSAAESGNDRTE